MIMKNLILFFLCFIVLNNWYEKVVVGCIINVFIFYYWGKMINLLINFIVKRGYFDSYNLFYFSINIIGSRSIKCNIF